MRNPPRLFYLGSVTRSFPNYADNLVLQPQAAATVPAAVAKISVRSNSRPTEFNVNGRLSSLHQPDSRLSHYWSTVSTSSGQDKKPISL